MADHAANGNTTVDGLKESEVRRAENPSLSTCCAWQDDWLTHQQCFTAPTSKHQPRPENQLTDNT